ncbi:hypothetical protein ACW23B_29185 [Streptomyces albidoflavus]
MPDRAFGGLGERGGDLGLPQVLGVGAGVEGEPLLDVGEGDELAEHAAGGGLAQGLGGEGVHLLVGAAPLVAELLELLLVGAEVVRVAPDGRLEAASGDGLPDLEAPAAHLEEVPGADPLRLALGGRVEPLLGGPQPVVEDLELVPRDVLGAGAGTCLPAPVDVAGPGDEQRQGRVRLGLDGLGYPVLHVGGPGHRGDQPGAVLGLGTLRQLVAYGRPVGCLGRLADAPDLGLSLVLVHLGGGAADPSPQRGPRPPEQRHDNPLPRPVPSDRRRLVRR